MLVKFLPPSELDANINSQADQRHQLNITPHFFTPAGPATVGIMVVHDKHGTVLDRCLIQISGKGRITLGRRTATVAPTADDTPDESTPAKAEHSSTK